MSKKLFIIGVGRSGTTLIMSMMNAHSQVAFVPETHFIKKYIVPALKGKLPSSSELTTKLQSDKDIQRLGDGLDYTSLSLSSNANELANNFWNTFESIVGSDVAFVGDKDPMNAPYLSQIKSVYPDAYILHIIRDPRDVILSRIKSEWGKNTPFFLHVAEYQSHIYQALGDGRDLFGEQYHEIKYEDLLDDSEGILKGVCEWLNLPYEQEMLNYQEKAKALISGDEVSWKSNVFKPVMKNNTAKWKKELNQSQIAKIESGLENLMTKLGYEISGSGNFFQKNIASLPIKMAKLAYRLKAKKESV